MKSLKLLFLIVFIISISNTVAQTVYITNTGAKYHKSNCRYLKNSKKEIDFEKAKSLGYSACKVCKPTSKNTTSKKDSTTSNSGSSSATSSSTKKAYATQCTGRTKAGARCKRKTKSASGRCYQH